jgi:hypothetical protein
MPERLLAEHLALRCFPKEIRSAMIPVSQTLVESAGDRENDPQESRKPRMQPADLGGEN